MNINVSLVALKTSCKSKIDHNGPTLRGSKPGTIPTLLIATIGETNGEWTLNIVISKKANVFHVCNDHFKHTDKARLGGIFIGEKVTVFHYTCSLIIAGCINTNKVPLKYLLLNNYYSI